MHEGDAAKQDRTVRRDLYALFLTWERACDGKVRYFGGCALVCMYLKLRIVLEVQPRVIGARGFNLERILYASAKMVSLRLGWHFGQCALVGL